MICIYWIYNKINGKFYIGQTIDFYRRVTEHMNNPQPKMRDDVELYGWDVFKFEPIHECTREELTPLENHYIKTLKPEYNTLPYANGMPPEVCEKISRTLTGTTNGNTSFLGKHHTLEARMKLAKPVICVETNTVFWSVKTAAEYCNISVANIEAVLQGRQLTAGSYHWRYLDESLNGKIRTEDMRKRPIICQTTGQIFESIEQAANILNLNPCGILHVLRRRAKSCGGYKFKYLKQETANKKSISQKMELWGNKPTPIICVETKKIYQTVKEAGDDLHIPSQSISAVLNGRRMSAGNLHFKYVDETLNVPEKQPSSCAKPVIVLETKEIYPSVSATGDALNVRATAVSAALRGRGLAVGGFHVMFLKDYNELSANCTEK